MKRVVIIGGGAAGLAAGIAAACDGIETVIVEKNMRPARKLMITGKGRCNVTNNCDVDTLIKNVVRNGKFLYSAFSSFSAYATMQFFEANGVPLKTERGNRVFPVSDKASDIVDALVSANIRLGNKIINKTASGLSFDGDRVTSAAFSDGTCLDADAFIIATGGKSYPLTGSTGDGYEFALSAGHTVTEITPSLVPLECHEGFCSRLSGLTLKNVTLSVYENGKKKPIFSEFGEMLFTHFGISGPLVLSASARLGNITPDKYTAVIDLKPALSYEQLDRRILRDFSGELNKDISNALFSLLPKSLVSTVLFLAEIDGGTKINSVSRKQRQTLVNTIKNIRLGINRKRPIDEAIITSGGVSVKEIEPMTMRSKIKNNLYFAGELIDVDAYTGGFNLQIAFSTGYSAGKAASKQLKSRTVEEL